MRSFFTSLGESGGGGGDGRGRGVGGSAGRMIGVSHWMGLATGGGGGGVMILG